MVQNYTHPEESLASYEYNICFATELILAIITWSHLSQHMVVSKGKPEGYRKLCCIKSTISEVKIFLTFCYLLIVMVLLWTSISVHEARANTTLFVIDKYVRCMSGGVQKEQDCESYRRELEALSLPGLTIIYYTLFSFLSYSNLPFLIQFKTVKLFVVKTARRLSTSRRLSSISWLHITV